MDYGREEIGNGSPKSGVGTAMHTKQDTPRVLPPVASKLLLRAVQVAHLVTARPTAVHDRARDDSR